MSDSIIAAVQQAQMKDNLPEIITGDTVDVHVRIVEGTKERIQVYRGVIIAINGKGLEKTVTVRRIVANEGVERVFPIHSPRIAKVEVISHGRTRRSKLYYLRDRVGKGRRLQDSRKQRHIAAKGSKSKSATDNVAKSAPDPDPAPAQEVASSPAPEAQVSEKEAVEVAS